MIYPTAARSGGAALGVLIKCISEKLDGLWLSKELGIYIILTHSFSINVQLS